MLLLPQTHWLAFCAACRAVSLPTAGLTGVQILWNMVNYLMSTINLEPWYTGQPAFATIETATATPQVLISVQPCFLAPTVVKITAKCAVQPV